jgi:hypothetical protein
MGAGAAAACVDESAVRAITWNAHQRTPELSKCSNVVAELAWFESGFVFGSDACVIVGRHARGTHA